MTTQQIQIVSPTQFKPTNRGCEMTLVQQTQGHWEMRSINASTRAYHRGIPMAKVFNTLEEVEAKYKSWKGIVQIHKEFTDMMMNPPAKSTLN